MLADSSGAVSVSPAQLMVQNVTGKESSGKPTQANELFHAKVAFGFSGHCLANLSRCL